jgi:hypothetical protein
MGRDGLMGWGLIICSSSSVFSAADFETCDDGGRSQIVKLEAGPDDFRALSKDQK